MTSTTMSASCNSGGNQNNRIEEEYKRIPEHGWEVFYQEIRDKCEREADERNYETNESAKPQNRYLNRYRDVNPYDHSRIVIHRGSVDYINANLVMLERAERKYILTQGPLCDTVGHFWLMVWEQNTKAILMLNKLTEKNQVKCHRYWPGKKGPEHAIKLEEVRLTVEYLRCEEYKNYCRRWLKLTDLETKQSREIIQFHYTTWPDFGIPSSPVAFLQFLKQVRDSGALDKNVGPAVVHCSAGIGRSGTFCLVDCCLVLIDKEGEDNVSVKDVLYELRRYRMGLIQTPDQLYFSYKAIIEGIKLLKDPDFVNYKETPALNCSDDEQPDPYLMDETPPPLPPRTHSLQPAQVNVGSSASSSDPDQHPHPHLDSMYLRENAIDALNNFINSNMLNNENNSMTNRPLPPLPGQPNQLRNLMDGLYDSDSDEMEIYGDIDIDDDDDDEDDDDDDNNDVAGNGINGDDNDNDHHHEDFDNDNNVENENDNDNVHKKQRLAEKEKKEKRNKYYQNFESLSKRARADDDNDDENADDDDQTNANNDSQSYPNPNSIGKRPNPYAPDDLPMMQLNIYRTQKINGIQGFTAAEVNPLKSTENELKRRKRVERQANIEQKVNEIKRKQREMDESKSAAKSRKSLGIYIAAGVIVSIICVYAYTKLT